MNPNEVNVKTQTKESQTNLTPEQSLELLLAGNERFVESKQLGRDLTMQVTETSTGQFPHAVILGCIDSRVPSEVVFDQGIGDIFNTRIAGNFINEDILGSLEFACKAAGSKLIMVLGHTHCGAVKGACDSVKLGNLTTMLEKIQPAVDAVETSGERNSSNKEFVQDVSNLNVNNAIAAISAKSPVLKEMLDNGEIAVVGAMYDIHTGKVSVLS